MVRLPLAGPRERRSIINRTIDEGPPFGPIGTPPDVFRKNYFTFDLSGIAPSTITAGTLKLFLPNGGYAGPPSMTTSSFWFDSA